MKHKMRTRLAALLGAAALLAMIVPVSAASTPTVSVGSASITQGGTCMLTVEGKYLRNMTSLQFELAYDKSAFSVTGTTTGSMDVATADYSTAGEIHYIGISMDGISGNCSLLDITFCASAGAQPGTYPVTLFVSGSTADNGSGDEHITVTVKAGSLTVSESGQVYFSINLSTDQIESGEEVTMTISSNAVNNLAGGKFVFLYDDMYLAYKDVTLLPAATASEHTCTVNAANEGRITFSFVSENAVRSGDLIQLTLTAKDNVSGIAQVQMEAEDLIDVNANPLRANSVSGNVTISEKARVWLQLPDEMNTHEPFTVEFWVDGASGLAAGDFSVSYDPDLLECLDVRSDQSSEENVSSNGFVVIDDAWKDGSIEFSVLYASGIAVDTKLLTIQFRTKYYTETEVAFTPAVTTKPVNRYGNVISLDCPTAYGTVVTPNHACENGYCIDCGKDVLSILYENDELYVYVPGLENNGKILIAFYNSNGKMLKCVLPDAEKDHYTVSEIPSAADLSMTKLFIVDDLWCPLRPAISPQ